jgi:hypothetical protein
MRFEEITLHRFKQFRNGTITLKSGLSLLVGGNNAGKSSVLHALAVWEFCKTILEFSKGRRAWVAGAGGQGIGIGSTEFSPISVPSFRHLWTNLKSQRLTEPDGYTLKIKAAWKLESGELKHLEFGLSLANDRLFIKTTTSNLKINEIEDSHGIPINGIVPNVAYLPPFAGITDKESRHSPAARNRLIGQGLSGGVIRNVLYDMWEVNKRQRAELRGGKTKISSHALSTLRAGDPCEILSKTLGDLFQTGLTVSEFDDRYHTFLEIQTYRGKMSGQTLKRATADTSRDLMVEGSGFLQWLSVYALALSPNVDVVLLDEPDAHLHCSLQTELVRYLSSLAETKSKQILMATHSTELIKNLDHNLILEIKNSKAKYLEESGQKIATLAGFGATFSPKLHALTTKKRMLILEGDFDENVLKIWAQTLGITWPANVVTWQWPGSHKDRRQLFLQIKKDIPDLKALSLRDRDDEADSTTDATLLDKAQKPSGDSFKAIKWRRRHIENYLIEPNAMARAGGFPLEAVTAFFAGHALVIPPNVQESEVAIAIRDARGKEILTSGKISFKSIMHVGRYEIARNMTAAEIADDIRTFFVELNSLSAN